MADRGACVLLMNLVIVESPTKAKTISKFLGHGYRAKSSYGHIRDLPEKELGVDVEHDFKPKYVIPFQARKRVAELKKSALDRKIILATDEDREGEAIAWHLVKALGLESGKQKTKTKKPVERIVFHEITRKAIENALKNPRGIDINLVNAQQARRILDRLVGYKLSPFLWKKIAKGLSAGRVQSVAVRLIVDRERQIQAFKPKEYWKIEVKFNTFTAKLTKKDGKTIPRLGIKNKKEVDRILKDLKGASYPVSEVRQKKVKKNPSPPLTTSTLQQEAAHKLGFSAKQTMMLAQQLYEGIELGKDGSVGLITYMRTDSLSLSEEALKAARRFISQKFGKDYLPLSPRRYKTKSKIAQEAHEAIRPTDPARKPEAIKQFLGKRQYKLYDLIWKRMIACQMANAILDKTSVNIKAKNYTFHATGKTLKFDGFLKLYGAKALKETILPPLQVGELLRLEELLSSQQFTKPPAYYTEATLVKALEEHGIGRPSTYAPIMSTIQERGYVKKAGQFFHPQEIGILVNDLLVKHFPNIVDLKFTAHMEEDLDKIAAGKEKWIPIIRDFYNPFNENLLQKYGEISKKDLIKETDEICEKCGKPMIIKVGRYGKFLACTGFPECKNTKSLNLVEEKEEKKSGEKCEKCGAPMVVRQGKFGPFLGCSNYPECKNIKPIEKSTGVRCPQCKKGEIVEKRSRKGRIFYGCNRYPSCKYATWNKPKR